MKSEREVQTEIVKYLKQNGHWVIKVMRANENGCPDLLCCLNNGRFIGIEVKTGYNKPSAWQTKQMQKINDIGGLAICVWSLNEVESFVKEVLGNTSTQVDEDSFLG